MSICLISLTRKHGLLWKEEKKQPLNLTPTTASEKHKEDINAKVVFYSSWKLYSYSYPMATDKLDLSWIF